MDWERQLLLLLRWQLLLRSCPTPKAHSKVCCHPPFRPCWTTTTGDSWHVRYLVSDISGVMAQEFAFRLPQKSSVPCCLGGQYLFASDSEQTSQIDLVHSLQIHLQISVRNIYCILFGCVGSLAWGFRWLQNPCGLNILFYSFQQHWKGYLHSKHCCQFRTVDAMEDLKEFAFRNSTRRILHEVLDVEKGVANQIASTAYDREDMSVTHNSWAQRFGENLSAYSDLLCDSSLPADDVAQVWIQNEFLFLSSISISLSYGRPGIVIARTMLP